MNSLHNLISRLVLIEYWAIFCVMH